MKILPLESRARLARTIDRIKPKLETPDEEIDDPLHDMNYRLLSPKTADHSSESNVEGNQLKESIVGTVSNQCQMLYKLIRPIDHAHAR
jgi:hypothetical protein